MYKRNAYYLLLFIMVMVTLFACEKTTISSSKNMNFNNKSAVRFLALGDSYTIGEGVTEGERWPNQLVEQLKSDSVEIESLRIIAQTGWSTAQLISAINNAPNLDTFNLVSLSIGVNNQFRGMSIEEYEIEFSNLLDTAIYITGNRESVFVLSIPDYGVTPFGGNSSRISEAIDEWNSVNKRITLEKGVSYFDITQISRDGKDDPSYITTDNLHPSGKQYKLWVESFYQQVLKKVK